MTSKGSSDKNPAELSAADVRRLFRRRYSFALGLVALVCIATTAVQFASIGDEHARAELIAATSEQAALSQRVAFLAKAIETDLLICPADPVCGELRDMTERMNANHELLIGGRRSYSAAHRAPILAVYSAGPTPFSASIEHFLSDASAVAVGGKADLSTLHRIEIAGVGSLMQTHLMLVDVLRQEARAALWRANGLAALGLSVFLILLIILSARVFAPLTERLYASFLSMRRAQEEAMLAADTAAMATEARGAFLKSASHELKTPLNAIMGAAQAVGDHSGLDGSAEVLLDEMSVASDHLLSILNTMLDTHRLDEGRFELSREPVFLLREFETVKQIGQSLATRRGLAFESKLEIDPELVIESDAPRLRQICLNLLDNAVRFTDEGRVTFCARVCGGLLELKVEDSGRGMTNDMLAAIFDRGAARGRPQAPMPSGIGLSLPLCKSIAERMGGDLIVRSELGRGTAATLSVPAEPLAADLSPQKRQADSDLSGALVLVVDDNGPNRLVAKAMVAMFGGRTDMSADGQEAVRAAMRRRYDLILMDIAMPVMDGIEAVRAIRQTPGPNRTTPIIAVTAHAYPEDVPGMIDMGFEAVVFKPMKRNLMADIFARYVAQPGREEATGT